VTAAPVTVTVTGAGGQIGYALVFRIASGQMLGPDVPVRLHLLEVPRTAPALQGVAMELEDCAYPALASVDVYDDPVPAFDGASVAMLVGARPRAAGMERIELLVANGGIFGRQGAAINAGAADDIRVLVVGNPANTNAGIVASHARDVPPERFTALTRLDHNRGLAMLAAKAGVSVTAIRRFIVWGNHSATQYPDVTHATIAGRPAAQVIGDETWVRGAFIPAVASRGAAVIAARGASSAASAAIAAIDHMVSWLHGTPAGDWTSAAVVSDGSYGVPDHLVSSFPVTFSGGTWSVVQGLPVDRFSRSRIDRSVAELADERAQMRALGLA